LLTRIRTVLLQASAGAAAAGGSGAALWTFPAILASAFVIAWGAEVAQFFMSQGLALAILAWLQILPEFAVEADIAWRQNVSNMTANFTGSIRLLVGLGWPMIFAVSSFVHHRRTGEWLSEIVLEPDHSIEVVGLLVPILYFALVWWKASLTVLDGAVLVVLYFAYLFVVNRMPPKDHEEASELDAVPRAVMRLRPGIRGAAVVAMFVGGGLILYFVAHPFVDSLMALALTVGISQYVFIQWVAPFLSEFPEFLSAFRWARTVRHRSMALMNVVSSNINQWTVLAGMIPIVYSLSLGHLAAVPFDATHRHEILLTILQSVLGMILLMNMRYTWWEAGLVFILWLVQFCVPSLRVEIIDAYVIVIVLGLLQALIGRRTFGAFTVFGERWRSRVFPATP
jgi:cation:H+ antiporter